MAQTGFYDKANAPLLQLFLLEKGLSHGIESTSYSRCSSRRMFGYSLEPWFFVVVQDRETLQRLAACGKYADHVPSSAFALALITSNAGGAPDFDLGQAAAYLQLAAWDLDIGSCITWMHFPEKAKLDAFPRKSQSGSPCSH